MDPLLEIAFGFVNEETEPDFQKIAAEMNRVPDRETLAKLRAEEENFSDVSDMLTAHALGLPASTSTEFGFRKSVKLQKSYVMERGVESAEARHALSLADYYNRHRDAPLTERLQGLVSKALTLLSAEDGEMLRKAVAALDLYIISAAFEKAFVGV